MRAAEKKNDFRKGLSKLNKRLVIMKTNGIFTCIALIALFASCKSGLVHNTVYNNDFHIFNNADVQRVVPSDREYKKTFVWYSDETYFSEKNAIDELEGKIKKYPEKTKYSDALEKFQNKLLEEYKNRVHDRMVFLRDFYSDMYKMSNKDFSKKYKRHCDNELLYRINNAKHKGLDVEGDHWYVFTDLKSHKSDDYKFSYMNGDPLRVNNSQVAFYIYEDSLKTASIYQYKHKYRLTDKEDKWYKISMGDHFVMVKVEEGKKHCKITGLVNPLISFAYMNAPQIPKWDLNSVKWKIGDGLVSKHNVNNP